MADQLTNKTDPLSREAQMVVIERAEDGTPTVWCDPEIVDLVRALNQGSVPTVASCSGHGEQHGCIALKDGRELLIAPNYRTARLMEQAINARFAEPVRIQGDLQWSPEELERLRAYDEPGHVFNMIELAGRVPQRIVLWSRGVSPNWWFVADKSDRPDIEGAPVYETLDQIVLKGSPEAAIAADIAAVDDTAHDAHGGEA